MGVDGCVQVYAGLCRCAQGWVGLSLLTHLQTIAQLCISLHTCANLSITNIHWFRWVCAGVCRCAQVWVGVSLFTPLYTIAHLCTPLHTFEHLCAHLCTLKYGKYTLV